MMQHLRHLRCGDSDLRAARAAPALTRRKEDQGYIVADPKMLDAVAALGS